MKARHDRAFVVMVETCGEVPETDLCRNCRDAGMLSSSPSAAFRTRRSKSRNNSVGTKQLKKSAVNSAKVRDRSLLAKDFRKRGQIPTGPPAPRVLRA